MSAGISRRTLFGAGAGIALAGGLGGAYAGGLLTPGEPGRLLASQTPLPPKYAAELTIPPVLAPTRSDASTDYYEITQRVARLGILPGLQTTAWTYGGSFPGPTIVSRAGRRTVVRHTNQLPVPTVVHLHGGHTPHDSDGYPIDLVMPAGAAMTGESMRMSMGGQNADGVREYSYPLDQRAATLWYHDHRMGATGPGVWRGLAGFHLVRDAEEEALPLPTGARELPLMVTDRSFAADGSFRYPGSVSGAYMNGVLGDVVLVNGRPWPRKSVDRALYRLRLLNASNARRYRFALDPAPPGGGGLVQIGSDGGLLARPVAHDAIDAAPAERFDVLVDFARYVPGTRVRLVNRLGGGGTSEVMRFEVGTARVAEDARIPAALSTVTALDPAKAAITRDFHFALSGGQWTINGHAYRPGRPLAAPKLGQTELWRFTTDLHHPVHLHLDPFQVLARGGDGPGAYDDGWKDTVDLRPAERAEIAVRFTDYTGAFMLHCHNLEHEDMGMMADFNTQ